MRTITRRLGTTVLLAAAGSLLMGCGNSGPSSEPLSGVASEEAMGHLALPLTTQGASGVVYRLRDATFNIYRFGYGGGVGGSVGTGGGGSGPGTVITVSSETDPDAATISVNVEEGSYYVELLPGWHFEKQSPTGYEDVEATLLSGETQYVWVYRRSTSFAEFQFGLGGREIWLNGELNIGVVLYEDPSELGYGGYGGYGGTGGSGQGGFAGAFGGSQPTAGTSPTTGGVGGG